MYKTKRPQNKALCKIAGLQVIIGILDHNIFTAYNQNLNDLKGYDLVYSFFCLNKNLYF